MKIKVKCLFLTCCLLTGRLVAQDISDANMKAVLIYQFAKYTVWENEKNIDKFRIGIYGNDKELLSELKIIESVKLKDKPVEIVNFTDLNNIDSVHLLYVTPGNNIELKKINRVLSGKNTLLVSDQCNNEAIIMINFLPLKGRKVEFEINKANIYFEKLKVLPELLLLGGTEVDIAELYKESQKSLMEVTEEADSLSLIAEEQYNIIEQRNIDITAQNEIIKRQKEEIVEEQKKITEQELNLKQLFKENEIQQKAVNIKIKELREHENKIEKKQNEIIQQRKVLNELNDEVAQKQDKIVEQEAILNSFQVKVEKRNTLLFILIPFTIIVLILIFFLHKAYRIKRQVNKEILRQKEEILAQSKELKKANKEIISTNEALNNQKEELTATLENLKMTQSQLIQSEKMASVGVLTAGIAHELNNPINFVSSNVNPLKRDMDEVFTIVRKYEEIVKSNKMEGSFNEVDELKAKMDYSFVVKEIINLLEGVEEGAKRSSQIVKGLRSFSRLDEEKFQFYDIHEGIDSTLILLHNKIKNRIKIRKDYDKLKEIECFPSKLNQVIMNILTNSIQAIDDKGEIFIQTVSSDIVVKLIIKDNGRGIPPEVKKHIFDPFFTTKDVGKGTGLGLSISYGIIEQHNGNIDIISEPGKGTEVILTLPIRQSKNSND